MGWLLKNLFRKNENEGCLDTADHGVLDQLINKRYKNSKLLFDRLDLTEKFKVIEIFKSSEFVHNKSVFIRDFESYVNSSYSNISSDVLNDFYKTYQNHEWIDTDEFITSLNQYLLVQGISESSPDLYFDWTTIYIDPNHVDKYLLAKTIYRFLRNLIFAKTPSYCQIYKELPIRYISHMYFDLISTVKKVTVNNYKNEFQSIIFNNFYTINQNEQRELYRCTALLN